MAKHHRIGAERKPPRMSYLSRSPNELPEVMSLDESETLLGSQYGGVNNKFISPSVTVVELDEPLSVRSLNKRSQSFSPTAASSPYTEQSTLTITGIFIYIEFYLFLYIFFHIITNCELFLLII